MIALKLDEAEIFNAARRIGDRSTRSLFLRDACDGDGALIQRIESLLAINDAPDRLLDQAVIQTPAGHETQTGRSLEPINPIDFLTPSDTAGTLGKLGHYDVLEVIGRGGMGIVLRAFDQKLQRVVAIKVMAPYLAVSPTAGKRFVREARAAAAIRNEHVIDLHAVEEENGLPYFVMEYVSGMSLQERLDRTGPLHLNEVLRIGIQLAQGLAAAHAVGMIHRDVKPANILLENGVERIKLTDFGLARASDDASLSQAGMIAGTPMYMSPEQARGEPIDPRSDLFSLGSVLYAVCTGRPPFRADASLAVLKRICEEKPLDPREIDTAIPEWLVEIINRLHAKDPAQRFQSATEVADVLAQHRAALQPGAPVYTPRPRGGLVPRSRKFRMGHVGILALAIGLAITIPLYGPTVYRYATNKGEIVIETDDPDVAVTVKQDGEVVQIVDKKSGRTVTLKAGRYQLELSEGANGLTLSTDQFTLERGGKEIVRVRLDPPAISEIRRFEGAPEGATYTATLCLGDKCVLTGGGSLVKDGNWTQGRDFALRLWDRATGKELHRLEGHTDSILCLGVSADGKRAVSGGGGGAKEPDFAVRVWDLENRKEVGRFTKHTGRVMNLAFLPDGKQVISVGGRFEVWLWDVETGKEVRQFKGHTHEVRWVAVLPDGKRFVTAGQDGLAFVWDVATGKSIRPLANGEAGGGGALTRDGRHVALSCSDNTIRLFEVETGTEVRRFTGHKGWAGGMAFSPDGRRFLSGSEGKTIHLWDVATGKEVCQFEGDFQSPTNVGGFTADGKEALVNSWDGRLRLLRMPPVPPSQKK